MIQTAKKTLLIILGSKRLSLDVFQTILPESEAILNSRPLTNVADLPDNEMPLTPNHFLISCPFNSLPPGKFDPDSSQLQDMAKSATDDEPLLEATCQRIPTDTTQEIKTE